MVESKKQDMVDSKKISKEDKFFKAASEIVGQNYSNMA